MGQPLQGWSTGVRSTRREANSWTQHSRGVRLWTSHSRKSPLVPSTIPGRGPLADQLVYGRPSGRPTTPRVVHWWTLHRLRVMSSGAPATPWRTHWWASHSWARTTGEPSTIPGSRGSTGGLHPKGGPLVVPVLQEMPACGSATLRDILRWPTTPGEARWALHQSNGWVLW